MRPSLLAVCILSFSLAGQHGDPPSRPKVLGISLVRFSASNLQDTKAFYNGSLDLREYPGRCFDPSSTCLWINLHQELELIPTDQTNAATSIEEIGFCTSDVKRMYAYLASRGMQPGKIQQTRDGNQFFEVTGPERHNILFTSRFLSGDMIVSNISSDIIHAGFIVHDRAAEDHFYKDILGFHVYWHGGMKDNQTDWVDMQVPDGTDWIEYMLNVPANADHRTLGVMNHFALGVPDIHAAEQQLLKNGMKLTEQPKIGRDGKWQLNLYDPDDTRVELMEFTPVEKPCCSEFTGPHPGPKR